MELETFVARTLAEIIRGVQAAQDEVAEEVDGRFVGAAVNPKLAQVLPSGNGQAGVIAWTPESAAVLLVEFDVAVVASESSEKKGGIGVVSALISVGAQGTAGQNSSSASRIRFSVPVTLPASHAPRSRTR